MQYIDFFTLATGFKPFPYQIRVAELWSEQYRPASELSTSPHQTSLSAILHIPTGSGKTAAAVIPWLWHQHLATENTPTRLIYCLPMRVLVQQTVERCKEWIARSNLQSKIQVYELRGGNIEENWEYQPERPAVIVGTQEQLLSRALNRGYAMSKYRWPIHFGLLNNDCIWIFDEIQLMDTGLATSTQLAGFRSYFGHYGPSGNLWMSATLQPDWLKTVDHPHLPELLKLSSADLEQPTLQSRFHATKRLNKANTSYTKATAKEYSKLLAKEVAETHLPASTTLVILNTVARALELYQKLKQHFKKHPSPPEIHLLHSRFRPADKKAIYQRLADPPSPAGKIIVSTQVIEAGLDISCRTMFTELAPWASLVQRFGRCNRFGENHTAQVLWIDIEPVKENTPPYTTDQLKTAREVISSLSSASPCDLPEIKEPFTPLHVLRKRDVIELFDTTPDLAGEYIDVSRFIRETDKPDVSVYWRDLPGEKPPLDLPDVHPDELCPVPLAEINSLLKKAWRGKVWRWDTIRTSHISRYDGTWTEVSSAVPGQVLLVAASAGGYSPETGWNKKSKQPVTLIPVKTEPMEAISQDPLSMAGFFVTLYQHTHNVINEMQELLNQLPELGLPKEQLIQACLWHDYGKAHPTFQATMLKGIPQDDPKYTQGPWAKSAGYHRHNRPFFRHELASALVALQNGVHPLVAYLVAAHHGKVRLSIRSLPNEHTSEGRHRVRGLEDRDQIPPVQLPGLHLEEQILDLSPVELGHSNGYSWLHQMLTLRDDPDLGPFRLAYLESLVRAADVRASSKEKKRYACIKA